MLVIASKVTEGFTINETVEVKILGFHGTNVKVGIKAPKHTSIKRKKFEQKPEEEAKMANKNQIK